LSSANLVEHIKKKLKHIESITAKEIMVPRIDVVSLPSNSNFFDVMEITNEKGHSRMPVWEKTLDNITGVLYAKDLLKYFNKDYPVTISEIIRSAYFVPESKRIISLLAEFKKQHIHLACVVDEYGGFSGIVTMEDILEEIVGDIQDEYDQEEEEIQAVAGDAYMVDARLSITDFNDQLGFDIPNEDVDTIGGFLFELFGRVPSIREQITYNDDIVFEVITITGNKIKKVKVSKVKEQVEE
jgi:magnesium and cobalt transporter